MNIEHSSSPVVRLLFLGDPRYDRRIQNFTRFFSSQGYRVEVIAGVSEKTTSQDNDFLFKPIWIASASGPLRFLSYHRKLLAELRQLPKADILFPCDLYSLRAAAQIKKNSDRTKLFYDAREIYTALPTVEHKSLVRRFWKLFERTGLAETDIVITTAPNDADALLKVHSFLPRSVVIKNMPYGGNRTDTSFSLRDQFSIAKETKIVVYVGGLQKDRGLEQTIEAATQLKGEAAFVLIGDGVLRESLKKKAIDEGLSQSVYFYGAASAEEVISLLRSADAGIVLINRESGSYKLALPSKLFEYLHAGLPVVSSPLEQVIDCMHDRDCIFYADEHNVDEIVKAIRQALGLSQESRNQIASDAQEHFTFEADAAKLSSFILHPSSLPH